MKNCKMMIAFCIGIFTIAACSKTTASVVIFNKGIIDLVDITKFKYISAHK